MLMLKFSLKKVHVMHVFHQITVYNQKRSANQNVGTKTEQTSM